MTYNCFFNQVNNYDCTVMEWDDEFDRLHVDEGDPSSLMTSSTPRMTSDGYLCNQVHNQVYIFQVV